MGRGQIMRSDDGRLNPNSVHKCKELVAAKAAGLKKFFTGIPCSRGHIAERYVSGLSCVICMKERALAWHHRNPEQVKQINKRTHAMYSNDVNFLAKKRSNTKIWQKNNPDKVNAQSRTRNTYAKRQRPSWADRKSIREIADRAIWLQKLTGIKMHVDHVIPLRGEKVSGLHVPANLRILPALLNYQKRNKFEVM